MKTCHCINKLAAGGSEWEWIIEQAKTHGRSAEDLEVNGNEMEPSFDAHITVAIDSRRS